MRHSGVEDDMSVGGRGWTNQRLNAERSRGNRGQWSMFFPDAQIDFARAWALKPVSQVAMGRGYVVTYDDGTMTWCDLCPLLEAKLRQQGAVPISTLSPEENTPHTSRGALTVKYVVLGAESSFYVKFDNGRMEWCGQDSFGEALRRGVADRHLTVEKVAFGPSGSWLILWNDMAFESEGMPTTLIERLKKHSSGRSSSASANAPTTPNGETMQRVSGVANGVKDVSVGPAGEWFVIYKDHSVQADNLPDSLYKSLSQIRDKQGRVRSIAFGENRSWFVRFWESPK